MGHSVLRVSKLDLLHGVSGRAACGACKGKPCSKCNGKCCFFKDQIQSCIPTEKKTRSESEKPMRQHWSTSSMKQMSMISSDSCGGH